jgi:type IV pilus assembly protein PilB
MGGRDIDFRVNSLPATHGESVVLRILDKEKALVDLEILGLHPSDFEKFNKIIKRPNGIFLVTGPTGSGKTTTLYAALKKLNKPDIKIITAENPVEYNLEGINQAEVNHEIGRTFSIILKAMLRQAPNVILVGEIRDEETATVGIQAALTGHLVFSTLHTNDAPSSISRLTDMGVKPFLVASAILAILAQRLLRRLCAKCKEPIDWKELPDWQLASVGLKPEHLKGKQLYGPVGCPDCNNTGYRGRLGAYELMEMTPQIRELAFNEAHTAEIRKAALQGGMSSLQMDGVRKVLDGATTIDEVLVITHRQDLKLS